MRWSKLKKSLDALLADSVKEHLQVHFTRYGRSPSTWMDRAWITWDGEEIHNFSTILWLRSLTSVGIQMYEKGERKERPIYYDTSEDIVERLEQHGIYSRQHFFEALET